MKKFQLNNKWFLKPLTKREIPVELNFPEQGIPATVPGTVHTDLLKTGLIPDPFYGDNEIRLKWIHENDWIYETRFDLPAEFNLKKPLFLVFQGIDTIAEIYLNGELLLKTDNMFRTYEIPVHQKAKKKTNYLEVHFLSPTKYGQKLKKEYGKLPVAQNSERVYLRKAQYSFGWDWSPSFPTMGIWRPVYLIQADVARIQNVRFHTTALEGNAAKIMVEVDIERQNNKKIILITCLYDGENKILENKIQVTGKNSIEQSLKMLNPKLWWPNGEGEPHLYQLKVELFDTNGNLLDEWLGKVGIRIVTLQTQENGKSVFRFSINGRPIFARGSNWIPADSFLPSVNEEKYRKLLTQAKLANMNMIRVWGGGIYEDDVFYQLCDELGLLVWQDFMFACGNYPEHPLFLQNIEEEIRQNINRLQHHPSLALWCGNNENEWIWFREHNRIVEEMPGYAIYHQFIPKILQKLDPLRAYWPSSPFGLEDDPNSLESGNRHQWDIWSNWANYTEVSADKSLFVTEFGFQGPANRQTLEKILPETERNPKNRLFEFHNKQEEGNKRLFHFLAEHLPLSSNWDDFIYLTQLNQALALKTCVEHWRTRWPKTAGSLIWQFNDCWPVTSWSLIDSELTPKIAYYFIQKAFAPLIVYFKKNNDFLKIFAMNQGLNNFHGQLNISVWDTEEAGLLHTENVQIRILANENKEFYELPIAKLPETGNWVIIVKLLDESNEMIHKNFYSNKRWRHLKMPVPQIDLKVVEENTGYFAYLTANSPAFFVDLYHPKSCFSNRGFIVLPDETMKVKISGPKTGSIKSNEIKIYMLNNYLYK